MVKSVEYYYTHKIVRETLLAACIDPNLTSSAKAVLACLFAHANPKTPVEVDENGYLVDESGKRVGCFPSQKTIAAEAQISEYAVSLAVKLLREEGYVRVKTSKLGNGYRRNNDYMIDLTKGKSPHQIRSEGKARLAAVKQGNEPQSLDGPSRLTRVGVSRPTAVGVARPTRVNVTRPTRVGDNVVNCNVVNRTNEDKCNVDASAEASSSPSSLDASKGASSSGNAIDDFTNDASNDVSSRGLKDVAPSLAPKRNSSPHKSPPKHYQHGQRDWSDVSSDVLVLTDEELGMTTSSDDAPDEWLKERQAKMRDYQNNLDMMNYSTVQDLIQELDHNSGSRIRDFYG